MRVAERESDGKAQRENKRVRENGRVTVRVNGRGVETERRRIG